jgi:hypothetical protein
MKTRVLLILLLFTFLLANEVKAQACFDVRQNLVGLAIGFNDIGAFQKTQFSVRYDRGIKKLGSGVISLGGYTGLETEAYTYTDSSTHFTVNQKAFFPGIRLGWHLQKWKDNEMSRWDLYAGVMMYYRIDHVNREDNGLTTMNFTTIYGWFPMVSAYAGAAYFILPKIALMTEVLVDSNPYVNLGIVGRFEKQRPL